MGKLVVGIIKIHCIHCMYIGNSFKKKPLMGRETKRRERKEEMNGGKERERGERKQLLFQVEPMCSA